jgi:hypothetical protein
VLDVGEPRERRGQDVRRGARGDVVDDERKAGVARNGFVMRDDAFLRRLVVVGRDQQRAVGAHAPGMARQLDRFARVVRARSGEYLDAPPRGLDGDLHHAHVLRVGESRGLARRAAGSHAVDARRHLELDELAQRRLVELAVAKWRHQRREDSLEHR